MAPLEGFIVITDFTQDFYSAMNLPKLKEKYSFLFAPDMLNPIWRIKKIDPFELELFFIKYKQYSLVINS